eukprot:4310229-Pyramimonas_sp.AAC.1
MHMCGDELGVVSAGNAHVHSRSHVARGGGGGESSLHGLQEEPLLRVHERTLVRTDAEQLRVKPVCVVEYAGSCRGEGGGGPETQQVRVPALGRYGVDAVRAEVSTGPRCGRDELP